MQARIIDRSTGEVVATVEAETTYGLWTALLDWGEARGVPRFQVPALYRSERVGGAVDAAPVRAVPKPKNQPGGARSPRAVKEQATAWEPEVEARPDAAATAAPAGRRRAAARATPGQRPAAAAVRDSPVIQDEAVVDEGDVGTEADADERPASPAVEGQAAAMEPPAAKPEAEPAPTTAGEASRTRRRKAATREQPTPAPPAPAPPAEQLRLF